MKRQRGLSLIELLVATVIGLAGTLAVMQVFVNSEAGRRTAGSMAESQSSGMVGLYALQRDIQQAGLGFARLEALGCQIDSDTNLNGSLLQPIAIIPDGAAAGSADNPWGIPSGDAGSDMIVVAYGDTTSMIEGAKLPIPVTAGSTVFRVSSIAGINSMNNADYGMIVEGGRNCLLTKIINATATFDVTMQASGSASYTTSGFFLELGRSPQFAAFAIRNNTLTRCDFMQSDCAGGDVDDTSVWVPVAGDIAAMQAQYQMDTSAPMDGYADVSCKFRPAGASCGTSGAPGNSGLAQAQRACDWLRTRAVQVALVTRSSHAEKEEVSPATIKLWEDSVTVPTTTGPVYTVPDRHFRYRTTYGAIPLRNVIRIDNSTTC